MSFLINSYAYATGGGADVIPDALAGSYTATYNGGTYSNINFQINGINQAINIKFTSIDLGTFGLAAYYLITNDPSIYTSVDMSTEGTQITNGDIISVVNGDYIVIGVGGTSFDTGGVMNVLNNSNSDSSLTVINLDYLL
jgi:hypothetical protein